MIKYFSGYILENLLYIMIYKHNIYEFKRYLVCRKEQGKIIGKSIENTERKYDEISQIIKKTCYL